MPAPTGTTYDIVVGWTSPIDIDLKDNGDTPEGTLGGDVALILKDSSGNQLDLTGNVTIQDSSLWRVRLTPDASDFAVEGIYRGRIKVTDANGRIAYFPNGIPDTWIVRGITSASSA